MAHDTKEDLQNLLDASGHYLARCFRVTRKDGTIFRLTNCDRIITFPEGWLDSDQTDKLISQEVYTPMDGWDASNARFEGAMKKSNIDLMGSFGGDIITRADILAGLWNWAMVDDFIVDYRYPFKGAFRHNKYRLTDFVLNDWGWVAQANTMTSELYRKSGKVYSDTCWHALGDAMCGINMQLAGTTKFRCKVTEDDGWSNGYQNIKFDDIAGSFSGAKIAPRDTFKAGHITWITGNNAGQIYPIRRSDAGPIPAVGMVYVYWVINAGEHFWITDTEGTAWKFVFSETETTGSSAGANAVYIYKGGSIGTGAIKNNIKTAVNSHTTLKVTASDVTSGGELPNNAGDSSVGRYCKLTQDVAGEDGNTAITEGSVTSGGAFKTYNFGENGLQEGAGTLADDPTMFLQYPLRAQAQIDDEFYVYIGCDKLQATCKTKPQATAEATTTNNFARFGGFHYMVGTTQLIKTGEYR